MNTVSRGIRNAFRNVVRTGSIVIILALSIGLIVAMLAARQAVDTKIQEVKSSASNTVTITPAGVRGFEGGGEALTSEQVASVAALEHVSAVTSTLSDRLTTDSTTDLESGIELGSLGQRRADENSTSSGSTTTEQPTPPSGDSDSDSSRPNPMVSITITGTNSTASASTFGGSSVTWVDGGVFDATADSDEAVVGQALAEKNDLSVGSTFTAYDTTLTVVGIYDAGTDFANNGIFVSLATLQRISDQDNSVTSIAATIDSTDNLSSATTAISDLLGDSADVVNTLETAEQTVAPLESVRQIALFSLIGAVIAGAVIILLTMIMIVRERRKEIGVMKAIGASNIGVMKQFIVEALTLTMMGMVVGLGIGVAASVPLTDMLVDTSTSTSTTSQQPGMPGQGGGFQRGIMRSVQAVTNIQASVGATTLLSAVGATLLIAILGSAVPSFMISKVKPAEAMRNE